MAALRIAVLSNMKSCGKNLLYLSFYVFRTLVLIGGTIFTSPTRPPFYVVIHATRMSFFSRAKALLSNILMTELIPPRLKFQFIWRNMK